MGKEEKRRIMLAAALDYAAAVRRRASGLASQAEVDAAATNLETYAAEWAACDDFRYRATVGGK